MRFRPARVSEESGDDAPTTEIQATLTVIGRRNAGTGRISLFGVRVVGRARRSVGDAVPATGGARASDDKGPNRSPIRSRAEVRPTRLARDFCAMTQLGLSREYRRGHRRRAMARGRKPIGVLAKTDVERQRVLFASSRAFKARRGALAERKKKTGVSFI